MNRTEMLQALVNFAKADQAYMKLVWQIIGTTNMGGGENRELHITAETLAALKLARKHRNRLEADMFDAWKRNGVNLGGGQHTQGR